MCFNCQHKMLLISSSVCGAGCGSVGRVVVLSEGCRFDYAIDVPLGKALNRKLCIGV